MKERSLKIGLTTMPGLSLTQTQLKDLMKVAILEIFQERRDLFQDLIAEALEDLAMIKAIEAIVQLSNH